MVGSIIHYDRTLSPTAAAVKFYLDLQKAGLGPINLGQGRETENAPAELFPPISAEHSPVYNSEAGGEAGVREAAAGWVRRFLGIPAAKESTFVLQKNGREGLLQALLFAMKQTDHQTNALRDQVMLPRLHWPMYRDVISNIRNTFVELHDGDLPEAFSSDVLAAITNTPHNPTGKIFSAAAMKTFGRDIEKENARLLGKDEPAIFHILDIPYFYALPDSENGKYYLEGGFRHVAKANALTPWIAIVSFSKALGMARPGLTFLVVHPDLAADMGRHLVSSGGISYDPHFFTQVAQAFQPGNDEIHRAHYAGLRNKYRANFECLKRTFGDSVVDGDPGMTALLKLDGIFQRTVSTKDIKYRIVDTVGLVEYIGNEAHVVTVDNGKDKGAALLRVALAAAPDKFSEAMSRLDAAIGKIRRPEPTAALRAKWPALRQGG